MSNNFDNLKEKIFLTSIDIIIFDGWSNKALFEASFGYNHSQNSSNNTATPTCSYIGQNGDQTTAYSCN